MKFAALTLIALLQFIFLLYSLAHIVEVLSLLSYRDEIQKQRADYIELYLCHATRCTQPE